METDRRVIARSRRPSGIYDILAAKSPWRHTELMDAVLGGCDCLRSILRHPVQVLQIDQCFETCVRSIETKSSACNAILAHIEPLSVLA